METQKSPTGEGAGKNRGEGPSEVRPPAEETIVAMEDLRQQTTDEACLKEAEAADEETFSEVNPTPGDHEGNEEEEEDDEGNYCPVCGCTGGCTCGNSELYSGHPWVFDG